MTLADTARLFYRAKGYGLLRIEAAQHGLYEMSPKLRAKGRKPIARLALEQALTEVIKTSHPECEAFVGVVVERIAPASPDAANWGVKGVRYGRANRELCDAALSKSVIEGLGKFELSD